MFCCLSKYFLSNVLPPFPLVGQGVGYAAPDPTFAQKASDDVNPHTHESLDTCLTAADAVIGHPAQHAMGISELGTSLSAWPAVLGIISGDSSDGDGALG